VKQKEAQNVDCKADATNNQDELGIAHLCNKKGVGFDSRSYLNERNQGMDETWVCWYLPEGSTNRWIASTKMVKQRLKKYWFRSRFFTQKDFQGVRVGGG
jgi:hypothetical protein